MIFPTFVSRVGEKWRYATIVWSGWMHTVVSYDGKRLEVQHIGKLKNVTIEGRYAS